MTTKTINATYGNNTPCTVFIYEPPQGGAWYVVEGSENVNFCHPSDLHEGADVELIQNEDHFNWSPPIWSEEELAGAVEF